MNYYAFDPSNLIIYKVSEILLTFDSKSLLVEFLEQWNVAGRGMSFFTSYF